MPDIRRPCPRIHSDEGPNAPYGPPRHCGGRGACRLRLRRIPRAVTYQMPIKQTLTRAERNRRVMNGIPLDAPRSERRKEIDRKPMLDLDAMDAEAELEIARKAQIDAIREYVWTEAGRTKAEMEKMPGFFDIAYTNSPFLKRVAELPIFGAKAKDAQRRRLENCRDRHSRSQARSERSPRTLGVMGAEMKPTEDTILVVPRAKEILTG